MQALTGLCISEINFAIKLQNHKITTLIYCRFRCHVTCRLTAKNRDQLRNPTLGNRVWAIPFKNGRNGESPTSGSAGNVQTDAPRSIDIDLHGMQQANAAALCGVQCIVYRQQQMGSGC